MDNLKKKNNRQKFTNLSIISQITELLRPILHEFGVEELTFGFKGWNQSSRISGAGRCYLFHRYIYINKQYGDSIVFAHEIAHYVQWKNSGATSCFSEWSDGGYKILNFDIILEHYKIKLDILHKMYKTGAGFEIDALMGCEYKYRVIKNEWFFNYGFCFSTGSSCEYKTRVSDPWFCPQSNRCPVLTLFPTDMPIILEYYLIG